MRLLTRSDFDGLCCAVLLRELGLIEEYKFVHPKDVQDGMVEVTERDILTNIPYAPGCGMWFDHHSSEKERVGWDFQFKGMSRDAPSCARVVWDYFGGHSRFPVHFDPMMTAVDKSDSGDLTLEEIVHPNGWIFLSFIMDPRTGLGRYRDYRISNYKLMEDLIEYCRTMKVEEILQLPDVQERITRYLEQDKIFRNMLEKNSTRRGNVILLDLRGQEEIYTGNRFLIYTLYPDCNASIQVIWGRDRLNTVMTCGHSVLNRTCRTDIGSLMLQYGGGGHRQVGTCQVDNEQADKVVEELTARMNEKG